MRIIDAITEAVVKLSFAHLPDEVVATATDAVTDAIGVGFAGSGQPIAAALGEALPIVGSAAGARLIGRVGSADPQTAALYNGAVIHALDFDDTNHPAYAHPSSHLVPVLLGADSISGERAVLAYVLGLEVEGRLGRTMNMAHYLAGWHTTGTFGTLAAATAACVAYELSADQTRTALGIAASLASGLRSNFGTMTKPLHAGLAAQNGVRAACLARAGFTSSEEAIDGRFGFMEVLAGTGAGAPDTSSWATIGSKWETTSPYGIAIKPYPACGATHPAIEAAQRVRAELGGEAIDCLTVRTTPHSSKVLIYSRPVSGLQGKFSMEFCVAAAVSRDSIGLATFGDAVVADPVVRALIERTTVEVHPDLIDNTEWAAEVEAVTTSGRTHSVLVPLAKGKRERWLTEAELRAKYDDCAAFGGIHRADIAWPMLRSLSRLDRLSELTAAVDGSAS